jgi:hypothetical protein
MSSQTPSTSDATASSDTLPLQSGEIEVNLICPKCEMQNGYSISRMKPIYNFTCPRCRTKFESRIIKVHDARTWDDAGRHRYIIYYQDFSGQRQHIDFTNSKKRPEIKLRPKDLVILSSVKDRLALVQNSTTRRYVKVSDPRCFLATYVYGADSPEVETLRQFRDAALLPSPLLAQLVEGYYAASPTLIRWFGNYPVFRDVIRVWLMPIVWILHRVNKLRD